MPAKLKYSKEIIKKICDEIEAGESVAEICRQDGMPKRKTVYQWLAKYPDFMEKYRASKMAGVEALVDQMMDIANDASEDFKRDDDGCVLLDKKGNRVIDGEHVQRSRLKIDTIKWVATKLVPRLYGDKTQVEHTGEVGVKALSDEQLKLKIISLQKSLRLEDAKTVQAEYTDVTPA